MAKTCAHPITARCLTWGALLHQRHEATDTGLAYAPVSQAHDHHHTQFNVLPCCTAAQTSSVPNVALHSPLQVAIDHQQLHQGGGGVHFGTAELHCCYPQ